MTPNFHVQNHRLIPAVQIPSPNFNERPQGEQVSLLVIHNISLPPGQFGTGHVELFFQNKLPIEADPFYAEIAEMTVSAHLFISREGKVTQFVDFNQRAWHAGKSQFDGRVECNDFSIGIEMEGVDQHPYTEQQYISLAAVTQALLGAYPSISCDRILGHCDIAPGRKTDPGPAFDWAHYMKSIGNR